MVNTYRELLAQGEEKLRKAKVEDVKLNAAELLAKAMESDCRGADFSVSLDDKAEKPVCDSFNAMIERRINGEPLQYLIGEWEFYGLTLKVGKGTLIPRQDTETIVDLVIDKYRNSDSLSVIDLCSGTGCIGIALEKNLRCDKVFCVEKSEKAAEYLKENLRLNGSRAELILGDVLDEKVLEKLSQADIIVCNPPYLTKEDMENLQKEVSFEPAEALFGGEDGLDFYRSITRIWKSKLKDGGMLIYEIGIGQEDEVMRMLIQHGFENVRCRKDLCGINRCVFGFYSQN